MYLVAEDLDTGRQNGPCRYVRRSLPRTRSGGATGCVLLAGFDTTEWFVRQFGAAKGCMIGNPSL